MIENIRKYTGLIIVTIVVLLLGFIFMGSSDFFRKSATGGTFATIDGRGYTHSEFVNIGESPMQLASQLRSFDSNGLEIMRFSGALVGNAESADNAKLNFFASRLILRQAREDFGIHPSDEAVSEFVESLQMFQSRPPIGAPPGTTGEFDQSVYNDFIQKRLGAFGLVERDFRSLIRDVIATKTLREILGGGLTGSMELAKAMAVVDAQQIEAVVADIDAKPIREGIKPTDEELKEYWETLKDAYQTEKRVKVSYMVTGPTYSAEAIEPETPPTTEEKTDEEITASNAAKAERADLRKAEEKEFSKTVNSFINELMEGEGAEFEKLIADYKWEIVATDWITQTTLPSDLKLTTRGASSGKTITDHLFSGLATGPDPLAPFTDALAVGTNQWMVARLDELEEPRIKTFEEAKEEITKRFIDEKTAKALREQVEAKTTALTEAVKGGESFTEAAKGLGLEPRTLGPFGISDTLPNEANSREIFRLASTVAPGELAEPFYQDDRAVIIHVTKREIIKDDNRGGQYDNFTSRFKMQNQDSAFSAWLNQRLEEAQIQGPQAR